MVESFRRARNEGAANLFDSRLDYDTLADREGEQTTVFTELRSYRRVGQSYVLVNIGLQSQLFKLFFPSAIETNEGQQILSLLDNRYIADSDGTTVESPLRSYAYVFGKIKLYRDEPEIIITSIDQITDGPPSDTE